MYRRVLQKPFLFQTGSTNSYSVVKKSSKPLKKVVNNKSPQEMKCTIDQLIKHSKGPDNLESTAAKNMF